MLRRQFSSGHLFEKTIVHCLIFREDNCPLLRRQLYGAQFMVKITVFREDNQPVLHLQRRQSTSASYFGKTIVLVLKKTILLEKTILPFPCGTEYNTRATRPRRVNDLVWQKHLAPRHPF